MAQRSLTLIDRLREVAELWCSATGRSLGALSSQVTNHGSFFERIGGARSGATTVTLEKFATFLADGANWPDEVVPEEALRFAHVTGVSVCDATVSPDSAGKDIGDAQDNPHAGGGLPPVVAAGGSPVGAADAPVAKTGDSSNGLDLFEGAGGAA